jgi:hypothetical protein
MYKKYFNWENTEFIVKNDVLWIPANPANSDYQEYLLWLSEGNIAEEWQPEEEK